MHHHLLRRQLKKGGLNPETPPSDPRAWVEFLERVSRSYGEADQDRYTVERALSISSAEMQERLDEARKMRMQLERTERLATVGTLAAGVAHEVNNPLGYMLANLELIKERLEGLGASAPRANLREIQSMLEDAYIGAARVRDIVRDLKTFARSQEDRRTSVNVRTVLESVLKMTAIEISHRAKLDLNFGEVPAVYANESRLAQVFLNLIMNAVQAIAEGSAEANTVRIGTGTGPKGEAVVEIQDTGHGIPPETLPRIFDPFFTTKGVGVGTGLGLAICHNIVAALMGKIDVQSEPGKGSTFRVILPSSTRAAEASPGPATAVSPGPAATGAGKILVVDDEPAFGKVFARILGERHDVVYADGGRKALEILTRDGTFDVIFCDLMMPDFGGIDLYKALEKDQPRLAERFFFLTGGVFTERGREFMDSLPEGRFLDKPIDRARIQKILGRMIRPR